MAATARQKRSYLHHQGEFQHQLFTFRSGHDSDHGGIVRISVGQAKPKYSNIIYNYIGLFIYAAQFFPYQECNITRGNRTPGKVAVATPAATRRSES